MKKALLLIILAVLLSCSSPEKKAQKLIKSYLKENLNDPKSYESVSFNHFDSLFNPFINTKEGRELFDKGGITGFYHDRAFELKILSISETNREKLKMYNDSIEIYERLEIEYEDLFNQKEKEYKGDFIGWEVEHTYRAKNAMGAVMLNTTNFVFNKEVTEIVNVY